MPISARRPSQRRDTQIKLNPALADGDSLLLQQTKGLGLTIFRSVAGDLVQDINKPLPFAGEVLLACLHLRQRFQHGISIKCGVPLHNGEVTKREQ